MRNRRGPKSLRGLTPARRHGLRWWWVMPAVLGLYVGALVLITDHRSVAMSSGLGALAGAVAAGVVVLSLEVVGRFKPRKG